MAQCKSGPFSTASTPGSVNFNLQDLVAAAAGKLSENFGLEDIPTTSTAVLDAQVVYGITADETPTT